MLSISLDEQANVNTRERLAIHEPLDGGYRAGGALDSGERLRNHHQEVFSSYNGALNGSERHDRGSIGHAIAMSGMMMTSSSTITFKKGSLP